MQSTQNRRRFLTTLSSAGAAGLIGVSDALAQQAVKLGCNGLIWISFAPTVFPFGVFVLASGAAVKVIPETTP